MTAVRCRHCGAERELTYAQIEVNNREKRACPSCGIGTEAVVVQEVQFQSFGEHIAEHEKALQSHVTDVKVTAQPVEEAVVEGGRTAAADLSEVYGVADPAPAQPEEPKEPEVHENTGIAVGPGGVVSRRKRAKP